jgi:hypothetical protein
MTKFNVFAFLFFIQLNYSVFAKHSKIIYPDSDTSIYEELYSKDVDEMDYDYVFGFGVTTTLGNYYRVVLPIKPKDNGMTKSRSKRKKLLSRYKKMAMKQLEPCLSTSEKKMKSHKWEWFIFETKDMTKQGNAIAGKTTGLKFDTD